MTDPRLLESALGYFELGLWSEALAELKQITPPFADRPEVLGLRVEIHRAAGHWARMAAAARILVDRYPGEAGGWIALAFAERRRNSVDTARQILEKVRARFPEEPIIPFNLGCYDCLLGDLEQARRRVLEAIALDANCLKLAREDEDLIPLHDFFRNYSPALAST